MQEKTTRSEESTQEKLLMSDTFTVWQEKLNRNMDAVDINITNVTEEIRNEIKNVDQKIEVFQSEVNPNFILSMVIALS